MKPLLLSALIGLALAAGAASATTNAGPIKTPVAQTVKSTPVAVMERARGYGGGGGGRDSEDSDRGRNGKDRDERGGKEGDDRVGKDEDSPRPPVSKH